MPGCCLLSTWIVYGHGEQSFSDCDNDDLTSSIPLFFLLTMTSPIFPIPSGRALDSMLQAFNDDLKSYVAYDDASGTIRPIYCCVCDSIPHGPEWSQSVAADELSVLLERCQLDRKNFTDVYPEELIAQYTVESQGLEKYILSPESHVDAEGKVIICKDCLNEMKVIAKIKYQKRRRPPLGSIANGYMIGEAPVELSDLTEMELAIISRVHIYCQSWVFYAGCHEHIKGWHTFFENRPLSHITTVKLLQESGVKGVLLVVLCNQFTSEQKALALAAVRVDPTKLIRCWTKLKATNFKYANMPIPNIEDIPLPTIRYQNLYVLLSS